MNVVGEATRIKARLRACTTKAEIDCVANEERDTVMGMRDAPGHGPALFEQIKNLKQYMLRRKARQ
ncbi:hypothetical protein [Ruegeria sp. EL01]|uniref:hypothetical protein n=1 Tax=Ruegeria sp. EL01 TaxID=2107578 RepID=UPI000EA7FFB7|nr:hypothetical protein [Ruegeria sp. EL01]